MTFLQLTTSQLARPHWIFSFLKGAVRVLRDWRARRATLEILRALDGRTLKDIGVHADEIDSIIYGDRNDRRRRYNPSWRSDRAA
jgi:uncharacterized protein YjiS (DUF1127 family)